MLLVAPGLHSCSMGEFQVANHLLNDFEKLEAIFQEEGYLFFRDVLDADAILRVKQDFIHVLQKQGEEYESRNSGIW